MSMFEDTCSSLSSEVKGIIKGFSTHPLFMIRLWSTCLVTPARIGLHSATRTLVVLGDHKDTLLAKT